MRLTLRNLLRFLDQTNLRSIERSKLEQLVDESEKADAWIKRIDSLRRNGTTTAPAVESNDPPANQVASYLDSTMGEQDTVTFEKSMLASDTLLTEVASCHEIRESLRNESSPSIPILLRQSIYDIGRGLVNYESTNEEDNEANEGESEKQVAALAASMEDLPYVDSKPDDPGPIGGFSSEGDEPDDETVSIESLSQKAQKKSRLALVSLLILAAGLLGLTYWLGVQAGKRPAPLAANTGLKTDGESQQPNSVPGDADPKDADPADEIATDNSNDKTDPSIAPVVVYGPVLEEAIANADPNSDATSDETTDEDPTFSVFLISPDSDESDIAMTLPDRPQIALTAAVDSDDPDANSIRPNAVAASIVETEPTMLIFDETKEAWVRVAAKGSILENTEVMVLPGTTGLIDFDGNVSVTVEGPSRFFVGQKEVSSGSPVIRPTYGKFQVRSVVGDVDIAFVRDARRYRLTLPVSESTVTANFDRYLAPGDDPRTVEPASLELFIASKGRVTISESNKSWMLPETHAMFRSTSSLPGQSRGPLAGEAELPQDPPRDFSVRLHDTVEKNFKDLPNRLSTETASFELFADLKSDLRQERRFAALSWLAFSGNYSFLIDFLNDKKNRNNWRSVVEAVRASIRQNPSFATKLHEDLLVAGQQDRDIMYKLLLGYSQEALEKGGDQELVQLLDHDSLCVRILAIERIRQITGGIAYGYQPNAERKDRRRTIDKQWKKALKNKELRYAQPPSVPMPVFSSVPPGGMDDSGKQKDEASGIE